MNQSLPKMRSDHQPCRPIEFQLACLADDPSISWCNPPLYLSKPENFLLTLYMAAVSVQYVTTELDSSFLSNNFGCLLWTPDWCPSYPETLIVIWAGAFPSRFLICLLKTKEDCGDGGGKTKRSRRDLELKLNENC